MELNKTICFFNSAKEWGGGEKWHFDMSQRLNSDFQNVIVFTNKNSALFNRLSYLQSSLFSIKVNNLSFLNFFKILKIAKILKRNKVSCIIINLSIDLKIAGIASKIAKVKHIIYRRGSAIPIKNSFFNRFIFKNIVTEIIANTEETKRTINALNVNLFPTEKIEVLYNGIDINYFDNLEIKKDEIFTIGNIGRLVKQKGQKYLIELAKELKNRNFKFKIKIGGSGNLENELKLLCIKENLQNEIEFLGFVENNKKFLSQIDVFVLTSIWEGFGYVLAEAMACYKPTIAFDISSNKEIIENNVSGFLVDFEDIKSLADKVVLLYEDNFLLKKMGENGRKRVEESFSISVSYKKLVEYLNSLT